MRVRSSLKACTNKQMLDQVFNIAHAVLSAAESLLQKIDYKFAHTMVRCCCGEICVNTATLTSATVQAICVVVHDNRV